MPGRSFTVQVRKSLDTSGMAAAVSGLIFAGRARWSYAYSPSKMCAVIVREYRSEICAGSKPVSATGNDTRSTFGASAGAGCASAFAASAQRGGERRGQRSASKRPEHRLHRLASSTVVSMSM